MLNYFGHPLCEQNHLLLMPCGDGYCGDGYCGDGYCGDGYCGDGYCGDGYCSIATIAACSAKSHYLDEIKEAEYKLCNLFSFCHYNKIQDTRAGLPQFLGWPEVLISFH